MQDSALTGDYFVYVRISSALNALVILEVVLFDQKMRCIWCT